MPGCTLGGKKSLKASRSKKRGGNALEAAIVPFGLLAIQQWFGTRSKGKKVSGGQKKQQQQQKTRKAKRSSRK